VFYAAYQSTQKTRRCEPTRRYPYQVVQAYDRALIKEIAADDAASLEAKLKAAFRLMKDRDGAPKPRQRSTILIRAAVLVGERLDAFARLIAQEGGKPLTDARIEAIRAVDGLRNAAEELRNFAGREIPMGLTSASDGRWAFTTRSRSASSPRSRLSTIRST
jgi:acyl-CoA reductase-like NAD-dependent aldehyde dehydrogenase